MAINVSQAFHRTLANLVQFSIGTDGNYAVYTEVKIIIRYTKTTD